MVRADLSADGEFLYVWGETPHDHEDLGKLAVLIVARRAGDGTHYRAGLVHDLYPLRAQDLFRKNV